MNLQAFHANLKSALLTDDALRDWAGKQITAIDGNIAIKTLNQSNIPACVFELQPGKYEQGLSKRSMIEATIGVAFVWMQTDSAKAFAKRIALPTLVNNAIVASQDTIAGAGGAVSVGQYEPLAGDAANTHIVRFMVNGSWYEYA